MNDNSTNTELLIQYLDGELSGEALNALHAQLAADTAMQQELENLRVSRLLLQVHGLKQKVSTLHTEMMQELQGQPAKTAPVRQLWKPWMRVAALLIVILGTGILYQYARLSSRMLFTDQYQSFALHENRGSATASTIDSLYNAGAYDKLLQLFTQSPPQTATGYFLTGNAAMRLNKADVAVTCFLRAQQLNVINHSHYFEDDLTYYLALAYLQNDEPQKALPLFEQIHADKSHPYNRQVSGWFLQKLHWVIGKK